MSQSREAHIRIDKLAGPGVPGLEHDPPLYHFDVPEHRLTELTSAPVAFLAGIGLGPEQGVAIEGHVEVFLPHPRWAWDGAQWIKPAAENDAGAPNSGTGNTYCCYSSGPDELTIHTHHGAHTDLVYVDA